MVAKSLVSLPAGGVKCPLCSCSCEAKQTGNWVLFLCDECKPFRISDDAIDRLAGMTEAHRMGVRHDVWQAHATGKILEIYLAPVGSESVLAYNWNPVLAPQN